MPGKIRTLVLVVMIGWMTFGSTLSVRNVEAFWPLSYGWECSPESPTQVICYFATTNPAPPAGYRYQWLFGDGSQTGRLASTSTEHFYAVSTGQGDVNFTVTLIGYSSATSSSPDNFIGCTISFANHYGAGGYPPDSGSCQ